MPQNLLYEEVYHAIISKKNIKWLWFLPILYFVVTVVDLLVFGGPFIIGTFSVASYTKDELGDLYWSNKTDFVNIVEIMLSNDKIRQIIINTHDDDWGVYSKVGKDLFPEEEWEQVEKLFKKIKPYKIMLSLRYNDSVVYFDFGSRKVDDKKISTSLYYFKNVKTMEIYGINTWVGTLEQLDGCWYIGEYVRDE